MKKTLLSACTSGDYFNYAYAMLESFYQHNNYKAKLLGINLTQEEKDLLKRDFPKLSLDSRTLKKTERNDIWFHRLLWFGKEIKKVDTAVCLDADALFRNPVDPEEELKGDMALHFRDIKNRPDLSVMIGFMMFKNCPAVSSFFKTLKNVVEKTDWASHDIVDQFCVSEAIKQTPELSLMRLGPNHFYHINYYEKRCAIYQPRGGVRTRDEYQTHIRDSLLRRSRLGAFYSVFNGIEHIEDSISSIKPYVDYIAVILQTKSYYGTPGKPEVRKKMEELLAQGKINHLEIYNPEAEDSVKQSLEKSNKGLEILSANGCTHLMRIDADELYEQEAFEQAKEKVIKEDFDFSACQMITYWKEPRYRLDPKEEYYVPFICKIREDSVFAKPKKDAPFFYDPSRGLSSIKKSFLFPREELEMHHLSYVREDIKDKLENLMSLRNYKNKIPELVKKFNAWKFPEKATIAGRKNTEFSVVEVGDVKLQLQKDTKADITVITPTGDREQIFSLCLKWMQRQTLKPRQWIIVDDGEVPLNLPDNLHFVTYIRREPQKTDPAHTLRLNILEALEHVKYPKIIFMEDDDWYSPLYIEKMSQALNEYDLFAEGNTLYYRWAQSSYKWMKNSNHGSLCETGMTSKLLPILKSVCQKIRSPLVDKNLWKSFAGKRKVAPIDPPLCVGMKQLPVGRKGQTSGHTSKSAYQPDKNRDFLRSLIGEDVSLYQRTFISPIESTPFIPLHDGKRKGLPQFFNPTTSHQVDLADFYKGKSAFLLLSGPSTTEARAEMLDKAKVFKMGVNNSPAIVRPNLWTCVDEPSRFLLSVWKDPSIQKIIPKGFSRHALWDNNKNKEVSIRPKDCPNVLEYHRHKRVKLDSWLLDNHFAWGISEGTKFKNDETGETYGDIKSVMLVAVKILAVLGFRKIFLVGADFRMKPEQPYAFEQGKNASACSSNNRTYRMLNNLFTLLKPHLEDFGVQIFNSTPDSRLTAFDYVELADALNFAENEVGIVSEERTANMYTALKVKRSNTPKVSVIEKQASPAPRIEPPTPNRIRQFDATVLMPQANPFAGGAYTPNETNPSVALAKQEQAQRQHAMRPRPPQQRTVRLILDGVWLWEKRDQVREAYPELKEELEILKNKIARFEKRHKGKKKCKGCSLRKEAGPLYNEFVKAVERNPTKVSKIDFPDNGVILTSKGPMKVKELKHGNSR